MFSTIASPREPTGHEARQRKGWSGQGGGRPQDQVTLALYVPSEVTIDLSFVVSPVLLSFGTLKVNMKLSRSFGKRDLCASRRCQIASMLVAPRCASKAACFNMFRQMLLRHHEPRSARFAMISMGYLFR